MSIAPVEQYECPCGITYDASTLQNILRHNAALFHQRWAKARERR